MFRRLKTLFGGKRTGDKRAMDDTLLAPDHPICAIGDIHGCDAQLSCMLDEIDAAGLSGETVVFLGDAIDRGPQSAQVLDRLFERASTRPEHTVVLMGNHERMMLDFIDDPLDKGSRWLLHGGVATLQSFGISCSSSGPPPEEMMDIAQALETALSPDVIAWLRGLPLYWASGNICCAHAALNPDKSPDAQSERSLLWGHPQFLKKRRQDELCVVHGHTIVASPTICAGRIAVDTGAYRGGKLSAVRLETGHARFIQV